MYSTIPMSFLIFTAILFGVSSAADELGVTVIRHRHCGAFAGPSPENEKFRFPSYEEMGRNSIRRLRNGCFQVYGGTIHVDDEIRNPSRLQVHLTLKMGTEAKPEPCINADNNNCGGVGSCIHCQLCDDLRKVNRQRNFVELFQGGRQVSCDSHLDSGEYNDVTMNVCLPPKSEFLKLLDEDSVRAERLWNDIAKREYRGKKVGLPVLLFARIYNRQINWISKRNPTRFTDMLFGKKDGMIGCHWLMLTVYDLDD